MLLLFYASHFYLISLYKGSCNFFESKQLLQVFFALNGVFFTKCALTFYCRAFSPHNKCQSLKTEIQLLVRDFTFVLFSKFKYSKPNFQLYKIQNSILYRIELLSSGILKVKFYFPCSKLGVKFKIFVHFLYGNDSRKLFYFQYPTTNRIQKHCFHLTYMF